MHTAKSGPFCITQATNLLVGGIQHAEMLQWAREEVENGWSSRG